jgi:hypothetical protein
MTREQKKAIEKQVYELVPITKHEETCRKEKIKRDYQRAEYRKLIIEQSKEKVEWR